jgi:acyl carrier protein
MQSIEKILEIVNEIFVDVLENDEIQVNYETTAREIEEWDSLNHISLVISIERKFNIHFTAQEIQSFKNVGEMCSNILLKLSTS